MLNMYLQVREHVRVVANSDKTIHSLLQSAIEYQHVKVLFQKLGKLNTVTLGLQNEMKRSWHIFEQGKIIFHRQR